jgi:hypothetical protein
MAYVTQGMRRKMADAAYEERHPELAAERIRYRVAAEKALADTQAKFPVLTAENFQAANDYREAHTRELLNHRYLKKGK